MRYFEDFVVGQTIELGTVSISEAEILTFARQYDPQPIHVDPEHARQSIYGGIIASGWQTVGLYTRLFVEGVLADKPSFGSPGVDQVRWLTPVRPGDTLTARCTVDMARPSQSKPDRGIVHTSGQVTNQHGETVMTVQFVNLIGRHP